MKLFKSKSGFTLIELLVVIGIIAVLAAIAIPSVAGLIDRSNVSADNTNADEYTNAVERFLSEYELYRQDIASGLLKDANGDGVPDNMDAAQSRVYNAIGATTMEDVQKLESYGLNGLRLDIDTKYPQNRKTAQQIVSNYTKTSSSTFEPKQSDMTYWYNTNLGCVVVAEKDIDVTDLVDRLPSRVNYSAKGMSSMTEWIDLNSTAELPDIAFLDVNRVRFNGNILDSMSLTFKLPNIKFFGEFDKFEKLYLLVGKSAEGLSAHNYDWKQGLSQLNDTDAKEKMMLSNELWIRGGIGFEVPQEFHTQELAYRIVYEYEENGETKYAYSPTITATYSEAPIVNYEDVA